MQYSDRFLSGSTEQYTPKLARRNIVNLSQVNNRFLSGPIIFYNTLQQFSTIPSLSLVVLLFIPNPWPPSGRYAVLTKHYSSIKLHNNVCYFEPLPFIVGSVDNGMPVEFVELPAIRWSIQLLFRAMRLFRSGYSGCPYAQDCL
jgi:hypothetical protein